MESPVTCAMTAMGVPASLNPFASFNKNSRILGSMRLFLLKEGISMNMATDIIPIGCTMISLKFCLYA